MPPLAHSHRLISQINTKPTVQPITGGIITGAFNASIQAGLAYPILYSNRTVEVPAIIVYGTTDDKEPYLIQLEGVGKLTGQATRVVRSALSFHTFSFPLPSFSFEFVHDPEEST